MPIYEYLCSNCAHKFELMRPMSESVKGSACPKCGDLAQRVVSLFCKGSDGSPSSGSASACGTCSASSCSSCPA
jgi:putative FmdB family regulatory protein